MQKWEYMTVRTDLATGKIKPRYLNDGEIPNWNFSQTSMTQYANQLGEQGWELVSVSGSVVKEGIYYFYVFKRPTP
jgi:hypothetical protein